MIDLKQVVATVILNPTIPSRESSGIKLTDWTNLALTYKWNDDYNDVQYWFDGTFSLFYKLEISFQPPQLGTGPDEFYFHGFVIDYAAHSKLGDSFSAIESRQVTVADAGSPKD